MKTSLWLSTILLGFQITLVSAQGAKLVSLSGGYGHSCAITDEGALYCWGQSPVGQLGMGDAVARLRPIKVPVPEKVVQVASGQDHNCAIFESGNVRCWGNNNAGQLGLGNASASVGGGFNQQVMKLPALKLGTNLKAKRIFAGPAHTCAIFDNGKMKCWGLNTSGALGIGDARNRGTLPTDMGDALPFVNLGTDVTVKDVALGTGFTCAVLSTEDVKCWGSYSFIGSGGFANLGANPADMGDNLKPLRLGTGAKASKVVAGTTHACALLTNGNIKCWGSNQYGVLGIGRATADVIGDSPSEMGDALLPVILAQGMQAESLSAGTYHTCAIVENSAVKCWGLNSVGQLGVGDIVNRGTTLEQMGDNLPYVDVGTKAEVKLMHSGFYHTCVFVGADLKCWGWNAFGQLGIGNNVTVGTTPTQMGEELVPVLLD